MRLYNSVSCTPIGTTRRSGASNWTPQSFLPERSTKKIYQTSESPSRRQLQSPSREARRKASYVQGSIVALPSPQSKNSDVTETTKATAPVGRSSDSPCRRQLRSPSREARRKASNVQGSTAALPSPQSKNSDVTETTKATAPVGGSFDFFHLDINMLQNQSSASTSYSDPSLHAMSSSSTWTTSTSLFRGQYEPFEDGSEQLKGCIELHRVASSVPLQCEPPLVVETPIQESSQIRKAKDVNKYIPSGFHRYDGANGTPHSRKTKKARTASQQKVASASSATSASGAKSLSGCVVAATLPYSRLSSFRDFAHLERSCSSSDSKMVMIECQKRSHQEQRVSPVYDSSLNYIETDDASDFLDELGNWDEMDRSSPFAPIERPPPTQPMELIAPFPCTPTELSNGASSKRDTSNTPFSLLVQRSGSRRKNYLHLPLIGGEPLFRSFPTSQVAQICMPSQTLYQAPRSPLESSQSRLSETEASRGRKFNKYLPMGETETQEADADGTSVRHGLDVATFRSNELHFTKSPSVRSSRSSFRQFRPYHEGNLRPESLWGMLDMDVDSDFRNAAVSERELFSLMQADEWDGVLQLQGSNLVSNDNERTFVVDPKRANDGSDILASINVSFEDIAIAIEKLDVNALNPDQLTRILPFIPTPEEKKALLVFLAENSTPLKTECEKFMIAMLGVHDAKRKLEAMIFMKIFADCMESIRNDAMVVQAACSELIRNDRFRKILGIILVLGNRLNLNGSDLNIPVKAIKVESLLELAEKKIHCGETKMLHWIARVVFKYYPNLVAFTEDMPLLQSAETLNWESSLTEFEEFEEQLYELRWLALGHPVDHDGNVEPCLTIPEEIERLRSSTVGVFTLGACVRMASVADELEKAQSALTALVQYFGEDEWYNQPHELLRVVAVFCMMFDAALREESATSTDDTRDANVNREGSHAMAKRDEPSSTLADKVDEIYQTLEKAAT